MTGNYKEVYDYILDSIDASGYDENPRFLDEKLQFLHDTFKAEHGWHVERCHNTAKALSDWLSGLPSAINIAFKNHEILELREKWGRIKANASESAQYKIQESWFPFMAMRINELWKKHDIK